MCVCLCASAAKDMAIQQSTNPGQASIQYQKRVAHSREHGTEREKIVVEPVYGHRL